ncbi:glycosyltransferase [Chryseosolibacter indicus]|uniref:Glycosyltransferase n=1 Tax=Chryseosolibacter indicus TaxID=2782351 RepID=A0ABS5VXB7_9BACT|nr:glycosyltransferase [Chryseosolibacter indicus]MBT1705500.1 glycosyltransferase [Chryseosolibacter indicus]
MIILTGCFFSLYYLFLIYLFVGWRKNFEEKVELSANTSLFLSVVIPVRNEGDNIVQLLQTLALQSYKNFEVIVVDDHSTDNSIEFIKALNLADVTCLTNSGSGKKMAITTAINASRGEVIVTTDGDCNAPVHWLESVSQYFSTDKTILLLGPVAMEEAAGLFSKMQQIEFASLIGSAASTAAFKNPTMCNGANLAFRKEAFVAVGGYEGNFQIASGDDEFLMRKISKKYPDGVRFLADQNAVVRTKVQPSLKHFFSQRIRWASKWKFNTSFYAAMLALFIFSFQCINILALSNAIIFTSLYHFLLLIIKLILEAVVLISFCRCLKISWSWWSFLVLQIVYPVYVLLVAICAQFQQYEWKGRRY